MNESILVLGERLTESNYVCVAAESNNLFSNSDQESTSGEEDVLGEKIYWLSKVEKLNLNFKLNPQTKRKSTNLIQIQY